MTQDPHRLRVIARTIKSLCAAGGDAESALAYASGQGWRDTPQVLATLKGVVTGALPADGWLSDTGGAADLAVLVRGQTILGRLPAVRQVIFDTPLLSQSSGASAAFVGPGKPIKVTRASFARVVLTRKKIAALVLQTRELARSSEPNSEQAFVQDLIAAIAFATDQAFIDSSNAGSADQPAAVTYGAASVAASGGTLAAIDVDLGHLIDSGINLGLQLSTSALVMHPVTASFLSRLRGSGGDLAFPGIGVKGGVLCGLPCITSEACPHAGSPTSSSISMIDGSGIRVADAPAVEVSTSEITSVEMSDVPANSAASGAATSMGSMFQTESMAIKAVRHINWDAAPSRVVTLAGCPY